MAPSPSDRLLVTSTPPSRATPGSGSDKNICKLLRDAGMDEESMRNRDKATLISYITKIEAEMSDYQHHMGLLILEKKEWLSKYKQIKSSHDSMELLHKHEIAAHSGALAEARKREDNLNKALRVEKECILNLEKALHETRLESAETKVAADSKLDEAHKMSEDAQKKFCEAEAKLLAAESLQAEASRYHQTAERKLREVETREDDLRRRTASFNLNSEEKDKTSNEEKQTLHEMQRILQEGQGKLLEAQSSLNQREEHVFARSQSLDCLEKELESSKASVEEKLRALSEEKSNLEMLKASLHAREEDITKKEASLHKREQDLHILREHVTSKNSEEINVLLAAQETEIKLKRLQFEIELERKVKTVEDEIENKRRAWELKEVEFSQKEDIIAEKEHDLKIQSTALESKRKYLSDRLSTLDAREMKLDTDTKEVQLQKIFIAKENEELNNKRLDFEKAKEVLEQMKSRVSIEEKNLHAMINETSELKLLQMKLKEEIDLVITEKLEAEIEAEKLKAEKEHFEAEWELIEEKRVELSRETEHVNQERFSILELLKEERDDFRVEKDAIRDQYKRDMESIRLEREAFIHEMEEERAHWFDKIQRERANFSSDIDFQKKELENSMKKRQEEIETYLKQKEREFEQMKAEELSKIHSLKEQASKEAEIIALEKKSIESEKILINRDRDARIAEWEGLNKLIEELNVQRQKLEEQRELLRTDQRCLFSNSSYREKLEELRALLFNISEDEAEQLDFISNLCDIYKKCKEKTVVENREVDFDQSGCSRLSSRFGWLKRCADLIFRESPGKREAGGGSRSFLVDGSGPFGYSNIGHLKADPSEEAKVIVEVPFSGNVDRHVTNSYSEHDSSGGKRRIKSMARAVDMRKKRRHDPAVETEEAVTVCATQLKNCEATVIAEDTNVRMDKIIGISEVVYEIPQ